MSTAHRDPLYAKNARLIRQQTKRRLSRGDFVPCIRCGQAIGELFDVGHLLDLARGGSNDMTNLGPEHRYRFGPCPGNRRAGGALGAHRTNAKRRKTPTHSNTTTQEGRLPW